MGYKVYNLYEAQIDKEKLERLINGMSWSEFHKMLTRKYSISLSYKGFMGLLNNNSRWNLTYAMAIADMVGVDVNEIFSLKKVRYI